MSDAGAVLTIADLLAELAPRRVESGRATRVGSRGDGGYVLFAHDGLRDLPLYSYGTGENDSFDVDFHRRFGGPVRQYDHTVQRPAVRDGLTFRPEGIASVPSPGMGTLPRHLHENGDGDARFVLKMDIEGGEWQVLADLPSDLLDRCEQLILELHDLPGVGTSTAYPVSPLDARIEVLRTLNRHFHCWHVHANNYRSVHVVEGFKVPHTMEVTYVSRTTHEGHAGFTRRFPTRLDDPCRFRCRDHDLDFWPFSPGAPRRPTASPDDPTEIVAPEKPFLTRRWNRLTCAARSALRPWRDG